MQTVMIVDFLLYSIHFRVTWDPIYSNLHENVYGITPNTYEIIQSIISPAKMNLI